MAGGAELRALAEIGDRLCADFGYGVEGDLPVDGTREATDGSNPFDSLGPEDERLIATARQSLARLASALEARRREGIPEIAVPAMLTGAELVMRSELARGGRLSALMPSFVYLVALPTVDQDEALELSRRTSELIEEALRE